MDGNTPTVVLEVVEPQVIQPELTQSEVIIPSSSPVKKSGGKGKWIASCLFILLLCCCCTIGSAYIVLYKTVDAVKFAAKSEKNTNLTYLKVADTGTLDWDAYVEKYPPKDLGNGTGEVYMTEDFLLKLFLNEPKNAYMADYAGIKISKDLMKIQIDAGSIFAEEIKRGNMEKPEGFNFNTEDMRNIYVNIELSTTADHKDLVLKSVKIGDSFLDLNTLFPDFIKQIEDEVRKSPEYSNMKEIEFQEGRIRMIVSDEVGD